jgi:hypothetical protein
MLGKIYYKEVNSLKKLILGLVLVGAVALTSTSIVEANDQLPSVKSISFIK